MLSGNGVIERRMLLVAQIHIVHQRKCRASTRSYIKSFLVKDGPVRVGIGRAGNVIGGGDWSKDRIIPDCVKAWGLNDSVSIRSPLATRPWQHVLEPLVVFKSCYCSQ